jgi:hypothetical protein
MGMYDDSNIPRWKEMGLTNEEIRTIQGKNIWSPYDNYAQFAIQQSHKHRDITGEFNQILEYLQRGLSVSEIARLINAYVDEVEKCVESNGYELYGGKLPVKEEEKTEEELIEHYIKIKVSLDCICNILEVDMSTLVHKLDALGYRYKGRKWVKE